MSALYRRRPKLLDVQTWTGDNLDEVAAFLGGRVISPGTVTGPVGPIPGMGGPVFTTAMTAPDVAQLWVHRSRAWCSVPLGDGIAREPDGSGFYPLGADRLAEDFTPADGDVRRAEIAEVVDRARPGLFADHDETVDYLLSAGVHVEPDA